MASQDKRDILAKLSTSLEGGANFAIIKFGKATHKTLEDLRRKLRENNAKMSVIKNTIFEKTINKISETEKGFIDIRKKHFPLKEKTAVLMFKGDWADGLKTYFKFIKDDESFGFKFGRIDDTIYSDTDMVKLAQLPSREMLIAKLTGVMKNPMARTTRALKFNMQKLVYILNQRKDQS